MPAIGQQSIVRAIIDAIQQGGDSALYFRGPAHPKRFIVTGSHGPESLWVYAWTLTFGGRKSLPDEFRIQMTSVDSPLPLNPDGYTALIGYEPSLKMFAGFDLSRHIKFNVGNVGGLLLDVDLRSYRHEFSRSARHDWQLNGDDHL